MGETFKSKRFCEYLLVYVVFACAILHSTESKDCLGRDQCACQFDDGSGLVSITSLGNTDGTAKFKDVESEDGSSYSYNPCFPFTEGDQCTEAAACLIDDGSMSSIGDPQPVEWKLDEDSGNVKVSYTTGGTGLLTLYHGGYFHVVEGNEPPCLRSTDVFIVCDPTQCEPVMTADGSQGLNNYQLTVRTVCGCPDGCTDNGPVNCTSPIPPSSSSSVTLGPGSVFLIVMFSFVIIYFVGGTIFLKFGRKAQGVEVIPNADFWRDLPFLIKDGCVFLISKITRRGGYTKY